MNVRVFVEVAKWGGWAGYVKGRDRQFLSANQNGVGLG